ncbi:protein LURP-one-related 11-like [Silene latifolia]|uniref:protein LURP-one-related 11-like n=1 Tax=Silene latifolia TaxID=37657 RepID=UPI003D770CF5
MKIHPQHIIKTPQLCNPSNNTTSLSPLISPNLSSSKEIFTLWMKSLILGGNGCTVFDSKGKVVYRVDNYCSKCCNKVLLMDSHGNVLLTILRKKFRLFSSWEGFRDEKIKGESWLFQVRKCWKITKKPLGCKVVVNLHHDKKSPAFKIEKAKNELSSCRIVDRLGGPLAEIKRKHSEGGVKLGDDVLTLAVEANVDHSLIMGLMVAFSLIHSRI